MVQWTSLRPAYFDDGTIQITFPGVPDLHGAAEVPLHIKANKFNQAGVSVRSQGQAIYRFELRGWYVSTTTRKALEDWWHGIIQLIDQSSVGTLTVPYPGGTAYENVLIVAASTDELETLFCRYTITFEQGAPCVT
jgi:hypothetical protein